MSFAGSDIFPLLQPLKAARRRIRLAAAATGFTRTLRTSLVVTVSLGAADYLLSLPGPLRLVAACGIGGYVVYRLARYVVRPMLVPLPLDVIAAELEKHHPELQDRLRSALVFSESEAPGSRAMQATVLHEAAAAIDRVDIREVTDFHLLKRSLLAIAPVAVAVMSMALWQPAFVRTAWYRMVMPLSGIQWPRSVQIQMLTPLPRQLPAGQRLQVSLRLAKGDRPDRKVIITWQVDGQPVQQQLAQRGEDGIYASALDIRPGSQSSLPPMRLWIEAGDDSYGPIPIELIPRLQVTEAAIEALPPAYTHLPSLSSDLRVQSASVPAGSTVTLRLTFNRDAHNVRLEPIGGSETPSLPGMQWSSPKPTAAQAQWPAERGLRFRVRAEDDGGFQTSSAEEYELIVRPDQLPDIQLQSPRRSEDRTPDAIVPVEAGVEDDYGVAKVALEARLLSADSPTTAPASTQPASLDLVADEKPATAEAKFTAIEGDAQRHRFRLGFPWKVASFPSSLLKPGDVIEFQLAAVDTYDLNGQHHPAVKTPPLRLTIVSQEQLLQKAYDELRVIASQLGELKTRQDRLQNDTQQLKEDVAAKPRLEAADEAVAERIAEQQGRAASQAKELAGRMGEVGKHLKENASPNTDLQKAVEATAKSLDGVAENPMKSAASEVKEATDRAITPDRRNSNLDEAARQQAEASRQIAGALEQLGDLGGLQRAVDIVQDILAQQHKLAKESAEFSRDHAGQRPEEMNPADRRKLDEQAQRQKDLAKQSEAAIDQLQAMAQRQSSSDPAASQAMSQASQAGKTQSVPQHQQNASSAISQNQSSQASSSQENAEKGLDEMLKNLKDAQQHKLEELARKLATMEQQLKNLIRRQAGHNLDNALLQNPQAAQADASGLIKTLTEKAGRDSAQPSGDVGQLTGSQQQTHRNASDLSADLGKVEGAADAAGHLNRAAGRMERATVLLKNQDLKGALTPPQMEALAELELTLKQVTGLKEKANEKTAQKKQDELRKAYEELKVQQTQIREVTRLLDTALSGGSRKRSDLVRLAQLSTDQQKLSERVTPLSEELSNMGSHIFAQVNDGIARDMNRVSTQLGEQKTGKPTQFQQGQILAKIEAILHGLKPADPEESKYATKSGGGDQGGSGGGGQQRKLPPAAELQLLRDLQALVNAATKDAQPEDQQTLPEIAGQQAGIRGTFDELFKRLTMGEVKPPDDKESRQPLAEEAAEPAKAAADELDEELLGGGADAKKPGAGEAPKKDALGDLKLMARRMTRSRVRLGEDHDPGQVTQVVQRKILETLDRLVDEAKKNQQQAKSEDQQSESQSQAKPKPDSGKSESPQASAGQTKGPAEKSQVKPGQTPPAPSGDIRETAKEWGGISQRDRQAIIESAGENIIEKYRTLTEEYYRALSTKATENR